MGAKISRFVFPLPTLFLFFFSSISEVFRGIAVGLCTSALKRLSQHTSLDFSGHLVYPRREGRRGFAIQRETSEIGKKQKEGRKRKKKREILEVRRRGGVGGLAKGGGLGDGKERKTNKGKHETEIGNNSGNKGQQVRNERNM